MGGIFSVPLPGMKRYLKPSISNGYIPIDLLLNVVYPLDMSKIMLSLPEKILKDIDMVCDAQGYERSEWIRVAIRERLYDINPIGMTNEAGIVKKINKEVEKEMGFKDIEGVYGMVGSSMVEQSPVKAKVTGPSPVLPASVTPMSPQPISNTFDLPAPEYLWDDHNLMPVYKQGEDDQFCSVWHQKGLKQRVYPIKKFRPDGSLELEGKFCKACIEGFKKQDGHLE